MGAAVVVVLFVLLSLSLCFSLGLAGPSFLSNDKSKGKENTGGVPEKSLNSAQKIKDASLCTGNRCR
jgi:hypothetical protein